MSRIATGEVIGEFYDRSNVEKFNPDTCRVETSAQYLGRLNTETSKARQVADRITAADPSRDNTTIVCAPPAPSTISHQDYSVSYYADQSILICAKGEKPLVLDDQQTYYRDTVEHLARCLGLFTQEKRAEIVCRELTDGEPGRWIDGIYWLQSGEFGKM